MVLTKKEAADFIGVTVRSIEAYAAKGKLTPARAKGKRGDITVYDEAELQKLKDARAQIHFVEKPEQESLDKRSSESLALARASDFAPLGERLILALDAMRITAPGVLVADKLTLSLAEASQLSGLSRNHLRAAIESKKLKARIIGRGWRVKRSDLEAYVKKL
jgi:excisionase family DNA binding protein